MGTDAPGGASHNRVPEPPLWETMLKNQRDAADDGERLQKVLAKAGLGSRRTCEELIDEGRVTVNGEVAILGRRVHVDSDVIAVDGVAIGVQPGLVYYLLNKPTGVVTTSSDTHGRETVLELVPEEPRVFSVGRLDMDTSGLLILTNDGHLANEIMHPSHGVEKEYLVRVRCGSAGVSAGAIRTLREGVDLEDGITSPATVSQPELGVLKMVIHEGRNRQIRRMCDAVGYPVETLVRTRIGPIRDTSLRPGMWRHLTPTELRQLGDVLRNPKGTIRS